MMMEEDCIAQPWLTIEHLHLRLQGEKNQFSALFFVWEYLGGGGEGWGVYTVAAPFNIVGMCANERRL